MQHMLFIINTQLQLRHIQRNEPEASLLPVKRSEVVLAGCVSRCRTTTRPERQSAARQRTDCVQTPSCLRSLSAVEQGSDQGSDPTLACQSNKTITFNTTALTDQDLDHSVLIGLLLWPPYGIGQAIIFFPVVSIFYLLFFPRLISALVDRMSTILPHMVWPQSKFRMQV